VKIGTTPPPTTAIPAYLYWWFISRWDNTTGRITATLSLVELSSGGISTSERTCA